MIRVLIVEDSAVLRELLNYILGSDPDIEVVGMAKDGMEAADSVKRLHPDAITMDINMPRMNGFEATRKIMGNNPTPIIIVSGHHDDSEVATTFRAMEAGATIVLSRPVGIGDPKFQVQARELVQIVKLMSEVKVVRRLTFSRPYKGPHATKSEISDAVAGEGSKVKLIAIGASTGGPVALKTLLSLLPDNFGIPIAIVQHMTAGFVQGFAQWLGKASGKTVQVAEAGSYLDPGSVFVAPDGCHMKVSGSGRIILANGEPENGLRPAVSSFFRSVAEAYGPRAVGVLLTGMGKDGAVELGLMRTMGSLTLAQDEASSVVHGMPGEAIRIGAARYILSLEAIGATLGSLTGDASQQLSAGREAKERV